jgi:hypothetical protein
LGRNTNDRRRATVRSWQTDGARFFSVFAENGLLTIRLRQRRADHHQQDDEKLHFFDNYRKMVCFLFDIFKTTF